MRTKRSSGSPVGENVRISFHRAIVLRVGTGPVTDSAKCVPGQIIGEFADLQRGLWEDANRDLGRGRGYDTLPMG